MGSHATTDNLARCADFTVAFATKETLAASDFVGIVSAKNDPQKMQKTGWTAVKAENVNAPVFTDFPMTFECRIIRKIDETAEGYNIVAEIVNILVDEKYLGEDSKPQVEKMNLITYEPVTIHTLLWEQRSVMLFLTERNSNSYITSTSPPHDHGVFMWKDIDPKFDGWRVEGHKKGLRSPIVWLP